MPSGESARLLVVALLLSTAGTLHAFTGAPDTPRCNATEQGALLVSNVRAALSDPNGRLTDWGGKEGDSKNPCLNSWTGVRCVNGGAPVQQS